MFSYYDTMIMLVEANRPIVLCLCWAYVASCNENHLYTCNRIRDKGFFLLLYTITRIDECTRSYKVCSISTLYLSAVFKKYN